MVYFSSKVRKVAVTGSRSSLKYKAGPRTHIRFFILPTFIKYRGWLKTKLGLHLTYLVIQYVFNIFVLFAKNAM